MSKIMLFFCIGIMAIAALSPYAAAELSEGQRFYILSNDGRYLGLDANTGLRLVSENEKKQFTITNAHAGSIYLGIEGAGFISAQEDHLWRAASKPQLADALRVVEQFVSEQFVSEQGVNDSYSVATTSGAYLAPGSLDGVLSFANASAEQAPYFHFIEVDESLQPQLPTFVISNAQIGKSQRLAVIGDSMATGILADTMLNQYPEALEELLLSSLTWSDYYMLYNYLNGESVDVSVAINPERLVAFLDKATRPYSAAMTTSKEWGLRAAIAKLHQLASPEQVEVVSHARNGAGYDRSGEVLSTSALEQINLLQPASFDYVVMMLGANDISHYTPYEVFTKALDVALATLMLNQPQATIILPLIPRITLAKGIEVLPIHVKREIDFGMFIGKRAIDFETDAFLHVRTATCPAVFVSDPAETDATIDLFNAYIIDRVQALRASFAGQLLILEETTTMLPDPLHMAVDGFHLNELGQSQLGLTLQQGLFARAVYN